MWKEAFTQRSYGWNLEKVNSFFHRTDKDMRVLSLDYYRVDNKHVNNDVFTTSGASTSGV